MNRHPLDPFSLVAGIAFAGLGAVLLDTDVDVADLSGGWLLPLPLLFLGLILGAIGFNRLRRQTQPGETDDETEASTQPGPA